MQVDETYVKLYGMVMGKRKMKGFSSQKEGIAIGTDSDNRIHLKDILAGHPTSSVLKKTWQGYIAHGSRITHDSLHGYRGVFDGSKPEFERWVNSQKPEEEKELEHINRLYSGIKWFLRKHHGIHKPYLDTYLCWYEILYNSDPDMPDFEEMVLGDILQKRTEINI